jgi:hypothetical protein
MISNLVFFLILCWNQNLKLDIVIIVEHGNVSCDSLVVIGICLLHFLHIFNDGKWNSGDIKKIPSM